ncbi:MAG: hydroxymethylbilane synthase, partial [Candidatus Rokubacteria bacterium]|nr:hydroxymethylbilane synthase [Candidatus Rokubacteria bacterium]
ALRQAEVLADALRRAWPHLAVELIPIRTSGDRLPDANLALVGGKGLFVREIDEALLDGRIELAVHSLKDLPAALPAGLVLAAFPERDDPRDVLVSRAGGGLAALPRGARVGTASLRRRVQLQALRPDLAVELIRGNVDTRLRKLDEGLYDAVVLAAAGLHRLGIARSTAEVLDATRMLPAVGQGTLAVEARADDAATRRLVGVLDHADTRVAAEAERGFLTAIGGSCTTPLAAYARREQGVFRLDALVATPDGARILRDGAEGDPRDAAALGRRVAERMLAAGAGEIVRAGQAA